jgi:AcrR family transcriptional regulator
MADGRRSYDSPVRRERAAETRARIVAAGSELVHGFETWDWDALTFRAVAERAGVGERTVYRHFPTERQLHDAVMQRLHEEAGVTYEDVRLANLVEVTGRVFASLARFPTGATYALPDDPTFEEVDRRRRDALHRVVAELGVDGEQGETLAAVLDVLWNLPAFDHLVRHWDLGPERASTTLTWLIGVVLRAAAEGDVPPG